MTAAAPSCAETNPLFLIFVAALGVVVDAATGHGLQDDAGRRCCPPVTSLLVAARPGGDRGRAGEPDQQPAGHPGAVGRARRDTRRPGAVLAILIGVNVGPNLTYTGSLATLLWRRVLHAKGHRPVAGPVHRARLADRARLPAARHRRAVGRLTARDRHGMSRFRTSRDAAGRSHLLVGGLAEVAVSLVDRPERSGMTRADHLVDLPAEHLAGVRGTDRHRHDQPRRRLPPDGGDRRPHGRTGGQPVVDDDHHPAGQPPPARRSPR